MGGYGKKLFQSFFVTIIIEVNVNKNVKWGCNVANDKRIKART